MVSYQLLLLKIIKEDGSLSFLIDRGLTYVQIACMFKKLRDSGYILLNETGYHLTESGSKILKKELKRQNYSLKDLWILPQEKYYCKQLPINRIVELPMITDLK